MSLVKGFHHLTLCAGGAQEDIDFTTSVLGQRLIKQTILFDGRFAHYHLYYSNADAEPGSVLTTFPYNRVPGRTGSGQIGFSCYTIPKGAAKFWTDHLKKHGAKVETDGELFGDKYVTFRHPSGLGLAVVEDASDKRHQWTTPEIGKDAATRGFYGAILSVRETGETERFFTDALGFKKTGTDGKFTKLEVAGGGANKTVILSHEPDKPAGSWTFGAGTPHHMALDVGSDEALAEQKGIYEELGYTDCSEIKDRFYFHSIYCRCPGGILVECAATAAGGFSKDETWDSLGTHLLLPPWFEERRAEIMTMLEPITVPESNGPVKQDAQIGPGPSRRTAADFVK